MQQGECGKRTHRYGRFSMAEGRGKKAFWVSKFPLLRLEKYVIKNYNEIKSKRNKAIQKTLRALDGCNVLYKACSGIFSPSLTTCSSPIHFCAQSTCHSTVLTSSKAVLKNILYLLSPSRSSSSYLRTTWCLW